jgi:2-polyprenyl-3-methyl-5-hydroxy-6-metoxy-1,4-benzoquinol methylase
MGYRLIEADPDPGDVRRLTYVPFLEDGSCVAIPLPDGMLALPAGEVEPGEHYLHDSTLRIPLMTAGYRYQRVTPFAVVDAGDDHLHAYAWLEGNAPYRGLRPHTEVDLVHLSAEELSARFAQAGDKLLAQVVTDAAESYRNEDDATFYARNLRLLEPIYLQGRTPQEGSGLGGNAETWRAHREMIVDGIHRNGTFLDVGCANGLLMESVREWAAERGFTIEPYGVDLGPRLVALARKRLPRWADRIQVGNAIDYVPADGRRFTFVHVLLDCVPDRRRGDLIRHALACLVEPGGRLLVSDYSTGSADVHIEDCGRTVAGRSGLTAWTDATAP